MRLYFNITLGFAVLQITIVLGAKAYRRRVWFFHASAQTKPGFPANKKWSLTRGRNY